MSKREILSISSPSYSCVTKIPKTSSCPVSVGCWPTAIANQLMVSPRISPISTVMTMESTIGTGFQVNFVNERLGIADMAHSKTPMTLRGGRDMDLSLIRYRTRLFG